MTDMTYFFPSAAQGWLAAKLRVPSASFENGANANAGNNSGLGINIGGGSLPEITGENNIGSNWTLKQQMNSFTSGFTLPTLRTPQGACPIGCSANVARTGDVATTWDTSQPSYSPNGAANSGGLSNLFSEFSPISTGTNQANESDGTPAYDSTPVNTGSAYLNTLQEGWVTTA